MADTLLPFDPRIATASDLQTLLQSSKVTSSQLVEIYLREIEKHDGYLKAIICTVPSATLSDQAKQLDLKRSRGRERSPLHGIPILDNVATHPSLGMDTTAGSLALVGSCPSRNADIVDRLIDAGAIIIGKANLSELSYFKGENVSCGWSAVGGQSQSAYVKGGDVDDGTPCGHSNPGGSSSGSAIAVSAGLAPISIGTETAGSLVLPAGRAALYTMKPTVGIVPQNGVVPISHLFDSAGPMTKNVIDLANLLDLLVDPAKSKIPDGGYRSVLSDSWKDLRVGAVDSNAWELSPSLTKPDPGATKQMNQEIENAYARIELQAKSFHRNVPLPNTDALKVDGELATMALLTGHFKKDIEAYLSTLETSTIRTLQDLVDFNREHANEELPPENPSQERLEKALTHTYSPEYLENLLRHARKIGRTEGIDKVLRENEIDVILGPADSPLYNIAAAGGYPIATMPLGYLDDLNGRPFGLAALASAHKETTLLKVQSAWEATFPSRRPPPYEVFSISD